MGNVLNPALCASRSRSQPMRAVNMKVIPICCKSFQSSGEIASQSSTGHALLSHVTLKSHRRCMLPRITLFLACIGVLSLLNVLGAQLPFKEWPAIEYE